MREYVNYELVVRDGQQQRKLQVLLDAHQVIPHPNLSAGEREGCIFFYFAESEFLFPRRNIWKAD